MEKKWWHNSVVYQVYPKSFNDSNNDGVGDINGIIEKLDYLKLLGVDVIWLSPVYKSPMDDNGYDISDYCDIAEEFGTMEDMNNLIAESKKRDIKIIMDLVVNHTSDEHNWFVESKKSKDNPYRDYYIWRDPKEDGSLPNGLTSCFSGPAWEYDEASGQYYLHIFSKKQPDLNWENPKVLREVYDMMNYWLDKGISGFRMDVIELIGKEIDKEITSNGPKLHDMLKDMNRETFGKRDVLTVGETWSATPEIAKLYSSPDSDELSMVFQFEHIAVFWDSKHGKWKPSDVDFNVLKKIFNKWQTELKDEGWNSLFWNNHDLPRVVSKYGNDTTYRKESAKMLATMIHMMKGTPYIYQGEEIGMTNVKFDNLDDYRDIESINAYKEHVGINLTHDEMMKGIYSDGRDNARTPMQWDDSKNSGFSYATPWINVNPNYTHINTVNALDDKNSIFYYYQNLIKLRKEHDVIVYGDFKPLMEDNKSCYIYERNHENSRLLVVINHTSNEVVLNGSAITDETNMSLLISNYTNSPSYEELKSSITLRPYESVVYII